MCGYSGKGNASDRKYNAVLGLARSRNPPFVEDVVPALEHLMECLAALLHESEMELGRVRQERDELRVELKQTLRDLDRQIVQTQKYKAKAIEYKEKSTTNLWSSFQNAAKVEICDRGTRKRHAKCHDSVESALTSTIRQKFATCVGTYQAVPELRGKIG